MASTAIAASEDLPSNEDLTPDELITFQQQLWMVLEKRARLYTGGESSSVPELTAQRLLASVCFTLEIDSDDLDPSRIRAFLSTNLADLFETKQKELDEHIAHIPDLWQQACLSTPLLKSIALKDTLESLREFTSSYDYRYFAHEIPSDIDYPLSQPVSETLEGVFYIEEYLNRLLIENTILQCFDLQLCKRLLQTIYPDYQVLIINLFEPVATNAIGLALVEQDIRAVSVGRDAHQKIAQVLNGRSKKQVERLLKDASSCVCDLLSITDERTRSYLEQTAADLTPRIMMAQSRNDFSGIFLTLK